MTSDVFKGANGGFARNMSAPPRSTVSFRPYGASAKPAGQVHAATGNASLRHVLRADPDALLLARLPDTLQRIQELHQEWLKVARRRDKTKATEPAARMRVLRLAGLVALASSLDVAGPRLTAEALADETTEVLQDRLVDQAGRLPPCPALPAMAVAESRLGGASSNEHRSTDVLAVLWTLTHLNGRTFDRDGLPLLAPNLADGGIWDLYTP